MKIFREYNKDELRWEYIFTDGNKYAACYLKDDYPFDREELLMSWFNSCLRILNEINSNPDKGYL